AYGAEVTFTTLAASCTFTDSRDSRVYKCIQIGTQTWMAENLAYLPAVSPSSAFSDTDPYYYVYGYEGSTVASAKGTANYTTYGVLYNWPAALTACPSGWHLPTDEEWKVLEKNQGMSQSDADASGLRSTGSVGGKLKEAGTSHWISPSTGATNISGFTALPGGYHDRYGGFSGLGNGALFWSSSEIGSSAWNRYLYYSGDGVYRYTCIHSDGFSVRCLQGAVSPMVSTAAVTNITVTNATGGGNVTSDGGATVTARGVCWSTSSNPTTANSKTTDGTGTGSFTSNLTGLTGNTTYYIRAYATNSVGTSYGNEVSFKTSPVSPILTTTAITVITQTSASSGGNITDDGGSSVTARGVCWSTVSSPTTTNNKTTDGTGTGPFTSSLSGLTGNTTYYVRAYATNSIGTSYGNEQTFQISGTFIDSRDTNEYKFITIGTQIWMAENLKATKYNDGTAINFLAGWSVANSGAVGWWLNPDFYCWFNGDTSNMNISGALYSWPCISTGKLCPIGWHVPSDAEWETLITNLGGENVAGGKMKNATGWGDSGNGSNSSGFSAIPGGGSSNNGANLSGLAIWWSSSITVNDPNTCENRYLQYNSVLAFKSRALTPYALSIRCLKD
ncbi:MAG: hypothetical protein NTV01_03410, partial [Bacteroidia bacterium]|nr:hypothetical protein [Bacteroidia bacterium]